MRERLKRRKSQSATPAEKPAALAPLQPKFYDNESAEAEAEAPAEAPEPVVESDAAESSSAEPDTSAPARPSRRRRRGRGRRGGTSKAKSAETAAQPVAPEPSAPAAETAASEPQAETVASSAPASKGIVVLAIGLPGSGKSSWFKRHSIRPLSSDLLRELLFDDAQEQRFQDLVFSNLRSMLKARLIARRPMNYVDATNLTPHDRHSWIKLAKDYGYEVQGLFFNVPLDVCLERNQRRNRVVDEPAMRRMAAKLKPPTFDEGFSKITVVRVKQKE